MSMQDVHNRGKEKKLYFSNIVRNRDQKVNFADNRRKRCRKFKWVQEKHINFIRN